MIFAFSRLNPGTSFSRAMIFVPRAKFFMSELKLNINFVIAVDHAWVAGKRARTETGVVARRSEPDI
jgi:hypothetical protein